MTTDQSIVTFCIDEKKWVNESIRTFTAELKIDIEPAPCVFQVPKTLTETKPQAYAPRKIGLGPYHHLTPKFLAATERHKLNIAKNCLNNNQVQNFVEVVINKLCSNGPNIRAYYDKYLDLEDKTLMWALAIDSLYLLNLLSSYVPDKEIDSERRELAQDVMMLENQIPSYMLIETRKALNQPYDNLFTELFFNFCRAHSPLKLTEQYMFRNDNTPHLLAYLHHLIINNIVEVVEVEDVEEVEEVEEMVLSDGEKSFRLNDAVTITETLSCVVPGGDILAKHISFMQSLPWDRIKGMIKKDDHEKKPLIEEIKIPSVTELNEIAKINFKVTEGGIRDIKFVEQEEGERVFYLPEITLNSDSEVILRNLVAYEAAVAGQDGTLELAEYVDLMCGIVDTPKDVDILKKSDPPIIKGSLSNEEIADLFNGITKTTGKYKKEKSDLEKAIETVNDKFDDIFRVKAHKFMKKHIYKSWKFLSVLSTIVLIMLLSLQAFCQVYGCSSRWFHPTPK